MKISELKKILGDQEYELNGIDHDVCIVLDKPSLGSVRMVKLTGAHYGFDWEHGKLLLYTKESLVEKTDNEEAYDRTREFLWYMATKPVKRKTYEIEFCQRILKSLGHTDEEFNKYRDIFHK